MINTEKLKQVIEAYKADFVEHFEEERYKWEAVKCFQDNWDINADDFAGMLKKSLSKTYNLLASGYAYPRRMLKEFAEADSQAVKSMFIDLFDETKDLAERIESFISYAESIRKKYDNGTWKNHYQNTNAVSTYLWLKYPDKYYIYKYDIYKKVANEFEDTYSPKANGLVDNLIGGYKMYDEICSILHDDKELIEMLSNELTNECYPDIKLKTLTIDFGYYFSKYYNNNAKISEFEMQSFHRPKLLPFARKLMHKIQNKYTKELFLKEVYITEKQYETLAALLKHKKNIILQGAPGVGKTFTAKRLAYALMGEKDDSRIEFIQFHQSYSYEDFIMGYRPNDEGSFELREGVFYRFCDKARNDPKRDYFFIIDEINRGNLSKIFGELLMLIEKDYRSDTVTLAYRDEKFSVPDNLYIIGMMNTADRSLAMIDYALRRRFSFFEMEPGFDSDGFKTYSATLSNELFDALIGQIKLLNKDIEKDSSLGKGFCVGHSYFCNLTADTCTDERLHAIVEYDIIPILSEYWFDDKDKVEKWSANLRGIFNDD